MKTLITQITFLNKDMKKEAFISLILFTIAFLVGVISVNNFYHDAISVSSNEVLTEDILHKEDLTALSNISYYILNNISTSIDRLLISVQTLGIIGLYDFVFDAFDMGCFISLTALEVNINPILLILFSIVPHGIFEIPAIILTLAVSLFILKTIITNLFNCIKHKNIRYSLYSLKQQVIKSFVFYLVIVIPLLILGGIIEATITPILTNFVLR